MCTAQGRNAVDRARCLHNTGAPGSGDIMIGIELVALRRLVHIRKDALVGRTYRNAKRKHDHLGELLAIDRAIRTEQAPAVLYVSLYTPRGPGPKWPRRRGVRPGPVGKGQRAALWSCGWRAGAAVLVVEEGTVVVVVVVTDSCRGRSGGGEVRCVVVVLTRCLPS